jgi:4-alpha-glucanotransferase
MLRVPGLAERGFAPDQPFDDRLRDAFLELIFRSGANLVLLPIQDIFGWRDRINVPGTVGDGNWTWRLPFPLGDLGTRGDAAERAAFLRQLAGDTVRSVS